ncbi:MAG TPA: restriction endonuclease subunit S, partial [Longimicrobiaceae bacterium]|nr:restriction endonuclease subunit S [Longimicrobiaceae bacterium]
MSPEMLLREFDAVAEAPDGVQRLRDLILQLAVRGKLVPFGGAAPSMPLKQLLDTDTLNGISTKPNNDPPGVPVLRISAGTSRTDAVVDEGDVRYLEVDDDTIQKFRLEPGDLLACRFNGNLQYVGKFSLYLGYSEGPRLYPDKLIRFRMDRGRVDPAYVRYAMNSADLRHEVEALCATTAGNIGLSATKLKAVPIPVPVLDVQRRIVEKVDQLMALCDELEERQRRRVRKRDRLNRSALHHLTTAADDGELTHQWARIRENFGLLYDAPETVTELRQAVLQLAVRGKLVPQDPSDEPASVLLERIEAEKRRLHAEGKIGKPKKLPAIALGEVPFGVPEGWEW